MDWSGSGESMKWTRGDRRKPKRKWEGLTEKREKLGPGFRGTRRREQECLRGKDSGRQVQEAVVGQR